MNHEDFRRLAELTHTSQRHTVGEPEPEAEPTKTPYRPGNAMIEDEYHHVLESFLLRQEAEARRPARRR
jgi:hypothetical protein